jgi:hypothetical protein
MPLSVESKNKAETLVLKALESDDREKRHEAAEAHLRYRLQKSFYPINETSEIDLTHITCAEYQLFLDEMQAHGKCFHPDHWSSYKFPKGDALKPILGVRSGDAEAFCSWLTRREGGLVSYRLPNSEEAQSMPLEVKTMAAWCKDLEYFRLIGLGDHENKIRKELEQLLGDSNSSLEKLDFDDRSFNSFDEIPGGSIKLLLILIDEIKFPYISSTVVLTIIILLLITISGLIGKLFLDSCLAGLGFLGGIFMLSQAVLETLLSKKLAREITVNGENIKLKDLMNRDSFSDDQLKFSQYKKALQQHENYTSNVKNSLFQRIKHGLQPQHIIEFYLKILKVILARYDGTFPVWEGIRLARDKKF